MIIYIHTDCDSETFNALTAELDKELFARYGEKQEDYTEFNDVSGVDHAVIGIDGEIPIGCGCFKRYDKETAEIKRMFVKEEARGKGVAQGILKNLEEWAKSLGYKKLVLQTGSLQPEAINLYGKIGFTQAECYRQYKGDENSVCFAKNIE